MSFLFNMFTKNNKEEINKYDRITFKINLSDHIPQYYETTTNKPNTEIEATPDHPLYYTIFPKKQPEPQDDVYVNYTVKENDTFFGLAIRLDISEQYLRNINGISGSLYPGMVIKLPKDTDLTKLEEEEVEEQTERFRISQLLNSEKPANTINHKYTVYYFAGTSGDIKGVLTVNNNYIIFNPLLEDTENINKFTVEKLLKFNVLVEMADIQKAESLRIPQIDDFSAEGEPKFNNIVQFMLYKVGNIKIERKYKERLKQLKIDNKAIASISFSFKTENDELAEKECSEITNIVNEIVTNSDTIDDDEEEKKRLTNIPFFDIISEKIVESDKSSEEKNLGHIITKTAIFGILSEESGIITKEHFENLVKKFPLLYKLYNWQKAFSARRDGSAFNTFLNKTKNIEPAIILIKEYKGNILGAFLVESIETGKTGRGEMFIFAFKGDSTTPEVYEWTTKNDFFVYLENEKGLGIGMGIEYGIFMNRNLEKGSSAATNTFGNTESLSVKENFHIDEVEVWGVDNTY